MTGVHLTPTAMIPSSGVRSASVPPWVCVLATCSVTFRVDSVLVRTTWWAAGESMLEPLGEYCSMGREGDVFQNGVIIHVMSLYGVWFDKQ